MTCTSPYGTGALRTFALLTNPPWRSDSERERVSTVTATGHRTGVVGVGYEGQQAEQFVDELQSAGVDVVVDVRLTPISRKRGFSKRRLAENLAAAGIQYEHLRALGNPKDNRAGFAGNSDELSAALSRYAESLSNADAAAALGRVTELAASNRVAVLCFEASDHRCHRQFVLSHVDGQLRGSAPTSVSDSRRRVR
jgi:uncharacterized protein (DUF488 family)